MPDHLEFLRGVEGGRALPGRRVHDDVVESGHQLVDEGLDPARARWEVVRHDERARHAVIVGRPIVKQCRRQGLTAATHPRSRGGR